MRNKDNDDNDRNLDVLCSFQQYDDTVQVHAAKYQS